MIRTLPEGSSFPYCYMHSGRDLTFDGGVELASDWRPSATPTSRLKEFLSGIFL